MLFTLVKNEWIKIFKRAKTWVVFGLFVVVIGFCIFGTFKDEQVSREQSSPKYKLDQINEEIKNTKKSLEEYKDSKNENEQLMYVQMQSSMQQLELEKKEYEYEVKHGVDNSKWKEKLDRQIKDINEQLDQTQDEQSKAQLKQQLKILTYERDNNINPGESWRADPYKYISSVFAILGSGLLVIGIAIFMSDIVSGECTPPTLKFLLIQPVTRAKVLLAKFIAVTTTVVGMIMGTELISFLIMGIARGFDASKVPCILGVSHKIDKSNIQTGPQIVPVSGSGYIVSNGSAALRMFLFQLLFIITCCAFIFMISSLFKSSMITMSISIVLVFAVGIISQLVSVVRKIAHLLFLNYGSPYQVLTGNIVTSYNNLNFSVTTGIIVMVVTAVVSYAIGTFVFSKKDILI